MFLDVQGKIIFLPTQLGAGLNSKFARTEDEAGNAMYFYLTAGEWKLTFKTKSSSNLLLVNMEKKRNIVL